MIKVGNANSSPVNGSPGMKKRIRAAPKSANRPALQFRVSREGQSLRSMTVASLRKAILSLHLKPGEKLTERELCELTGVSRSLMREALRVIDACIRRQRFQVHFPIECRFVRADDIYLSPASGRASASSAM